MAIIYPVAGGKGGIGKSFITANLGYLLAKRGKRVLLADLDLGGSNLHTLLGL
ncbi:MAG: P-loop NTPase, partial [Desulfosudaceae bacterium]